MSKYILLTLMIPNEWETETKRLGGESLSEEELAERKIQRIISGEDEPDEGNTVFMQYTASVKSYHERPIYIPKDFVGYFHTAEDDHYTVVDNRGVEVLVKESIEKVYQLLHE